MLPSDLHGKELDPMHASMHTYIHRSMLRYVRTFVCTYVRTYLAHSAGSADAGSDAGSFRFAGPCLGALRQELQLSARMPFMAP